MFSFSVVLSLALLVVNASALNVVPRRVNDSYLDELSDNQRALFDYGMQGLDANFGPPLLVE